MYFHFCLSTHSYSPCISFQARGMYLLGPTQLMLLLYEIRPKSLGGLLAFFLPSLTGVCGLRLLVAYNVVYCACGILRLTLNIVSCAPRRLAHSVLCFAPPGVLHTAPIFSFTRSLLCTRDQAANSKQPIKIIFWQVPQPMASLISPVLSNIAWVASFKMIAKARTSVVIFFTHPPCPLCT